MNSHTVRRVQYGAGLPAHAQTSAVECSAPADCYEVILPDGVSEDEARSFQWPGGTGPFAVDVFPNAECDGDPVFEEILVVAANEQEAADLLSCSPEAEVLQVETIPSLSGCGFFGCDQ